MKIAALPPWLGPHAAKARGIGSLLDYTLLRPEATREDVLSLCDEAAALGVWAVCVQGAWVALCAGRLQDAAVRVVTVIGFPLGGAAAAAKAVEARLAVSDGAAEVDMMLSLGQVRRGEWEAVGDEIAVVVGAAAGATVKVIVESAALSASELTRVCEVVQAAGAGFVKTSTGFHPAGGATPEAVHRIRSAVGPAFGVKASGGIRSPSQALAMLAAGANRIGTSSLAELRAIVGPGAPRLGELLAAGGAGG